MSDPTSVPTDDMARPPAGSDNRPNRDGEPGGPAVGVGDEAAPATEAGPDHGHRDPYQPL
ncbi:hypothetical protein HCA58_17490 [Micromonospora sp. HNM0581]|uniref:hypothetical protein n=1 Tax=Micromonospora sp. HNM0581 TaxID=2716341 RepID=UPI00146F7EBC|nr:hypothetical protein [Micromonospora sp. HNM0581]NLU80140.1 hypothetical protein [Micromonospora sp. HNM0581]